MNDAELRKKLLKDIKEKSEKLRIALEKSSEEKKKEFDALPESVKKIRLEWKAQEEQEEKKKKEIEDNFRRTLTEDERKLRSKVVSKMHYWESFWAKAVRITAEDTAENRKKYKKEQDEVRDESRKEMKELLDLSGNNVDKIMKVFMNDEERELFKSCHRIYLRGEGLYGLLIFLEPKKKK